jgi:hypothetical protein
MHAFPRLLAFAAFLVLSGFVFQGTASANAVVPPPGATVTTVGVEMSALSQMSVCDDSGMNSCEQLCRHVARVSGGVAMTSASANNVACTYAVPVLVQALRLPIVRAPLLARSSGPPLFLRFGRLLL